MENKDYIIGIDIGSSSVVMAAGVRNEGGEVTVLGVEVQQTDGCVKDGDIVNFMELGTAIANAKTALEGELGRRLNSAYIGISGRSVYCVRYEDYVEISDKTGCVTENELRELNSRIEMVVPGGGDEIVERIPLRYSIDDKQEVKNPLGAFGHKLSATYLFVMVSKQQIELIKRALHRADIQACGLCVNPTLLPELLLGSDESEEGVAIVDLGSDLTDISVVKGGKLWYFSSLPIGASSINNDLHDFLKISKKDIDQLKKRYGSAIADRVPDNTTVPVKTAGHAKKQILQRNIAEITEERLKDIAGFVARELKAAKYATKLPCGIVLTGGSAYLSNIEELFARELNMEVRLGYNLNGLDDESQQCILAFPQAAVAGLLLYGAKHNACATSPEVVRPVQPVQSAQPTASSIPKPSVLPLTSTPASVPAAVPTPVQEPMPTPVPAPTHEVEPEPIHTPEPEIKPIEEHEVEVAEQQIEEQKPIEEQKVEKVEQKEEKRSKWLDRFRTWVDDMFTDDLI